MDVCHSGYNYGEHYSSQKKLVYVLTILYGCLLQWQYLCIYLQVSVDVLIIVCMVKTIVTIKKKQKNSNNNNDKTSKYSS